MNCDTLPWSKSRAATMALLLPVLFAGCGKKDDSTAVDPTAPNMEADLAQTVAEQSDFYHRQSPADIPVDLTWQDGSDLPEFADPNAKKGGTFNYFITDFPRTLRTIGPDATGGIRAYLLDYVEPYMVHRHPNVSGRAYPGLTDRWAVDHSSATVYYHIDPTARWSDGKPITTADVEFTFYLMRSPHLRAPWYNDFYHKSYDRLTIFDDLTFAVTHPKDKPDLDSRYGGWSPYPRHAYQDFGPGWIERFQWRVTPKAGPYQVYEKDIDKGRSITLTRDKNWWAKDKRFFRGRFNPDRYRLDVIRDPDKAIEAFSRGDIDAFPLRSPKAWYESINEANPDVAAGRILRYKFYNQTPRSDWGLWINSAQPRLNNREIRVGLHYATNIDLVCQQYFRGDAVPLETRSDGFGWRTHPTLRHRKFDPEKARQYFAAAGYTKQGPDGVLMNDSGKRLSFTITSPSPSRRDILVIIKQEALKAGVEFNLEVLDSTTGFKKLQEKNHEIGFVGLHNFVELYPRYWEMYHGINAYEDAYLDAQGNPVTQAHLGTPNPNPQKILPNTNNMTSTFVPELDRLIDRYDLAESMEEIKSLAAQIEQTIHNDAAWINGWGEPFYRGGYWRYVKWPAGFNVMESRDLEEFFLHWIDTDERAEVQRARRTGQTYPAELQVFDQFKRD